MAVMTYVEKAHSISSYSYAAPRSLINTKYMIIGGHTRPNQKGDHDLRNFFFVYTCRIYSVYILLYTRIFMDKLKQPKRW